MTTAVEHIPHLKAKKAFIGTILPQSVMTTARTIRRGALLILSVYLLLPPHVQTGNSHWTGGDDTRTSVLLVGQRSLVGRFSANELPDVSQVSHL